MYGTKEVFGAVVTQWMDFSSSLSWYHRSFLETEHKSTKKYRRPGNFFKGSELRKIMFAKDYFKISTKTSPSGNTASIL